MWLITFAMIALMWFFYLNRTKLKPYTRPPRLVGDGKYALEIPRESKYLSGFEKICGRRTADCINRKTEANLTFENNDGFDKESVRVSIEGYTVGYLPQAAASELRRAVIAVGLNRSAVFECAAHIRGGWDASLGRQGNYAVWLDLPAPAAL
jgi:hypothetical protein